MHTLLVSPCEVPSSESCTVLFFKPVLPVSYSYLVHDDSITIYKIVLILVCEV